MTIEAATLTLDSVTVSGTTITEEVSGSLIQVDSTQRLTLTGNAKIQGALGIKGAIGNAGTVEIAGAATLLEDTLTNAVGGVIQVDDGQKLTLSGTEVIGGIINNFTSNAGGTIDVTGSSKIGGTAAVNAALNNGAVTVESGQTLTLDNVTVTGATITNTDLTSIVQVDDTTTLTLSGATIKGGTLDIVGTGEVYAHNGSSAFGATLDGVTVNNSGEIGVGGPLPSGSTLILDHGTTISGGALALDGAADVVHVETGGATLTGDITGDQYRHAVD